MRRTAVLAVCTAAATLLGAQVAWATCTCFVPPKRDFVKGEQKLNNSASKVVIARKDDRTVMTVANDYKGELKEFAMVVPVPTFIEESQIHVADPDLIDRVDAFTSPRLTEIQDLNPCTTGGWGWGGVASNDAAREGSAKSGDGRGAVGKDLGVTIDAEYVVGEYDIKILSAEQSEGLEKWLNKNGYGVPDGASKVFKSYVRQGMRFFVAKVNLDKKNESSHKFLRPLQIAYESPKFMLPIRLGMLNSEGPQDLVVVTLTAKGRVEPTNYRMVKMPTGQELPSYVKRDFHAFYEATFDRQVQKENMRVVYLEQSGFTNAVNVPTSGTDALSNRDMRELGVFWSGPVYSTRMRSRYDEDHFPSDFVFQETSDQMTFTTRFTVRTPWDGSGPQCAQSQQYWNTVRTRQEQQAQALARLTGWNINDIRGKLKDDSPSEAGGNNKWWKDLWE